MDLTVAVFVFFFGLIIGSFLNVVLLRLRTDSLFKKTSSFCLSCTTPLKSIDLMPLVSFYLLKGRCRFCGSKFSSRYFWVEVSTALLFVASYALFGLTVQAALFAAIFAFLVLITFYDLRHMIVPDEFVIPWNVFALLSIFISGNEVVFDVQHVIEHALSGLVLFLFFAFIYWITRGRGIGFADGVVALGIGFVLGLQALSAILLSFWIGAAFSIALILIQRLGTKRLFKKPEALTMKSEIPFVPYLALGFLLTLLLNVSII